MKIIQKIAYFFIIILFLMFFVNTNQSFAAGKSKTAGQNIESEISGFKATTTNEKSVTGLKDVVKKFLASIRVASALLLIVIVASTGIRYITETSANVKGEIKKTALPVVIGLVFIFGASYFAALILSAFEG